MQIYFEPNVRKRIRRRIRENIFIKISQNHLLNDENAIGFIIIEWYFINYSLKTL